MDDKFNVQEEALFFSNWLEADKYSLNTIEGYILYETGMRIGELLWLQLDDYSGVDTSKNFGYIYIADRESEDTHRQQKTGSRTIAVSMDLLQKIEEYIT